MKSVLINSFALLAALSATEVWGASPAGAVIEDGVTIYRVETPYQDGVQEIRVLLPDGYRADGPHRVLYVLPVEKGFEQWYGYGLGVLRQMDAHNRYGLIIVQMGFEKEPWFGDHASDPNTRQASYLKEFVVPFIENRYATTGTPEGRLLFGFSKSGWGTFSLILTYPEFFGWAAAWDAPMMLDEFRHRMEAVYGTLEQLDAYRPDLLAARQKRHFQDQTRLVLTGQKDWGAHTAGMHALLDGLRIPHVYDDSLNVPHRWDAGWMAPTLEALMGLAQEDERRRIRWEFRDLDDWRDDSQGESPRSYSIVDGVLRISTRRQTRDRVKVRTAKRFGAGSYTWRLYAPAMGPGDQASIGAFLYQDDRHEVDFEIGYGKAALRRELNAGEADLVCYCTCQGHPYSSSQMLVKRDAWHTVSIDIRHGEDHNYLITWLVNGKRAKQLQTTFGDETTFTIHCSMENLTFMGDHIPTQDNHALFDYVEFTAARRAEDR